MTAGRAMGLGLLLSLTGPQPEAFAQRLLARVQNEHAYEVCMAHGGDDDWQCELILERWPANLAVRR